MRQPLPSLPDAVPVPPAVQPPVHLRRVAPERNMRRWYALSVEVTLWGDWSCTRAFGRIGGRGGRVVVGLYESQAAAEAAFAELLRAKRRRGYREPPSSPSLGGSPPPASGAADLRRP